jgi:hypothetical protein
MIPDGPTERLLEEIRRDEARRWLREHPAADEKDFTEKVWPGIEQQLVGDQRQLFYSIAKVRMQKSGRYSM